VYATNRRALAEALNVLVSDVHRNSGTSAARVLEEAGVTAAQLKTLVALAGGATSVSGIAARLDVSQPTASRLVAALAAKGLVAAAVSVSDRRAKELTLTPAGRSLLRRIEAARVADLRVYVERLSLAQAGRLAEALSALASEAAA
jgi:MarR family transcriptional regulator, transcriptional regulator for hemolysin